MLVDGWDDTSGAGGPGLRCELFERDAAPPAERRWGRNQNVRPSVQVADLEATIAELQDRGVSVVTDATDTERGVTIELATPEGVRWSIAEPTARRAGSGLQTPHLGWVELKVADLDAQCDFYTETMGLDVGGRFATGVRLEQGAGDPMVFLRPGGERLAEGDDRSPFDVQPVWLSFEATDVTEARAWLSEHGRPIVQDVESHDWGGTDLVTRDADGNPIQVVEYGEPVRRSSANSA